MQLSPRKTQIATFIATGDTTKEVSSKLHIAEATVNNTKANIYRKLNVRNVGELAKWWYCVTFGLNPDDVDIKRSVGAIVCLALFFISVSGDGDQAIRRARRRRRDDEIECTIA